MNKPFISIFILFLTLALPVLSACRTAAPEASAVVEEEIDVAVASSPASEAPSSETSTPEVVASSMPEPTEEPTTTVTSTAEPSATPTTEPSATPTAEPTETPLPSPEPGILRTYEIVPDTSEARFFIDEVLLGNPKTVVGRTDQITGEILLDLQNPQKVEVGPIQVNARSLVTDNSFRNRALRTQILDSAQDANQFITFTPLEIGALGIETAAVGETYLFDLTGDMQIRDIVQPVTFEMMVTVVSETELSGFGETVVMRSDYDLQIPSVPNVANVSEEVKLEIEFEAQAAGE